MFDKLKADLAKALFSLPAVVGVEYGSGFASVTQRGSEHNDEFFAAEMAPACAVFTNANHRHGGMLGVISSGMPIVVRAAIKPTSSLSREQYTVAERRRRGDNPNWRSARPVPLATLRADRRRHDGDRVGGSLLAFSRPTLGLRKIWKATFFGHFCAGHGARLAGQYSAAARAHLLR